MNILIYDDEESNLSTHLAKLEKVKIYLNSHGIEVNYKHLTFDEFNEMITILVKRRSDVRNNGKYEGVMDADKSDIFIIEHDLFNPEHLKNDPTKYHDIDGENLAYLLRCFSSCKLVLGLNYKGALNNYDLSFSADRHSYCDINIGQKQLDNLHLWYDPDDNVTKFQPWSWPNLSNYIKDFDKRFLDFKTNYESKVVETLNFKDIFDSISKLNISDLQCDLENSTVIDISKSPVYGLDYKDHNLKMTDNICRIAVSVISKWLEKVILPCQDIFIDAPHLIERFPSLLVRNNVENWNKVAKRINYNDLGIKTELIENFRYKKDFWFSRPVWLWPKLKYNKDIPEVKESWKIKEPNYVFCEDASIFYPKNECKIIKVDLVTTFNYRYIRNFESEGIVYEPKNLIV